MEILPVSTSNSIADFQDNPDDEEDIRSSHEYLNDLEEEYQARALLPKSKRFFKKELRPTKDFEAKYNKVKAKLALLSLSASASKASTVKNKGLIAEAYEWDEEEVSLDNNEMVEVKVFMALAEDNDAVSKESARNADDTKVSIPGVKRPWLSKAEGFILPNHDNGEILPAESQRNTTDPSVAVTDSSATEYDSANESSVCNTPFPPLKKLNGAEPTSEPKTIKSILRSKSTFKDETLKCAIINKPSSAPNKGNKNSLASVVNSAPASKLKSVKIEDDPLIAIVMKEINSLKLLFSKNQSFYSRSNQPQQCDIKKPIWYLDRGCSRHMTGVKSYLHKYVKKQDLKWCLDMTLHAQLKGMALSNVMFDEKRRIIFNSNKEVVMIAPRIRDVYVLDMTSSAQDSCFLAKVSENLN
nr:hypothetical protein [Tanacetum cinerariifolium]GEX77792.1 hypothetical protein [Tanacetum cinerariifolium]